MFLGTCFLYTSGLKVDAFRHCQINGANFEDVAFGDVRCSWDQLTISSFKASQKRITEVTSGGMLRSALPCLE